MPTPPATLIVGLLRLPGPTARARRGCRSQRQDRHPTRCQPSAGLFIAGCCFSARGELVDKRVIICGTGDVFAFRRGLQVSARRAQRNRRMTNQGPQILLTQARPVPGGFRDVPDEPRKRGGRRGERSDLALCRHDLSLSQRSPLARRYRQLAPVWRGRRCTSPRQSLQASPRLPGTFRAPLFG